MKHFIAEFKTFINRGNVIDMAVGIIIGSAFTAIVNSLVNDVFMPLVSVVTGGVDFNSWSWTIGSGDNATSVNYGKFIAAVLNFLIMALIVFCLVKVINGLHAGLTPTTEEEATTKVCPFCQSEIAVSATRCPQCTSQLEGIAPQPDEVTA